MGNVIWFAIGLLVGLAADFFLVLFMTRDSKNRIDQLEKNIKPLKDRISWLERHMYRLVRAKMGDEFEGKL